MNSTLVALPSVSQVMQNKCTHGHDKFTTPQFLRWQLNRSIQLSGSPFPSTGREREFLVRQTRRFPEVEAERSRRSQLDSNWGSSSGRFPKQSRKRVYRVRRRLKDNRTIDRYCELPRRARKPQHRETSRRGVDDQRSAR